MLSRAPLWPDVSGHGAWTASVQAWVDEKYGPVSGIGAVRMAHPEPTFWVFAGDFTRTPIGDWFGGSEGAAGASIDAEEALVRCLGEIAERYSALTAPVEGITRSLDPGLMHMFPRCAADEHCPPVLRGQLSDAPVTHVAMTRLADGARVEVPAGYVHLLSPTAGEPVLTTPISSGLAFDPSLPTALWRGMCEVAERDALMLTWWQRRPAAEINLHPEFYSPHDGMYPRLANRLDRVQAASLRARFFDITTDFAVPTVVCVLTAERFPYLTVGAACRGDAGAACAKALDEAVGVRLAVRGWGAFSPPSLEDFTWLNGLDDHARLYAAGHLHHAFDFLYSGDQSPITLAEMAEGPKIDSPQTMAELRDVATRLGDIGLSVLWADLTAPELSPHGRVVKVVIPQMVPLSQFHTVRWLGTARLQRAGEDAEPLAASFNPYPHPFA